MTSRIIAATFAVTSYESSNDKESFMATPTTTSESLSTDTMRLVAVAGDEWVPFCQALFRAGLVVNLSETDATTYRVVPVSTSRGGVLPVRVGADVIALTMREAQVLGGLKQGLSNAAIGRSLLLSEDTIKTHCRRLFRKLGVGNRTQAVMVATQAGL